MASASWRAQRCTAMETALIDMEIDVVELTDAPAQSPEDEIRVAATAYAKAVGRDNALLELGRQSIRLNNLWMRLYKQLQHLQSNRPKPKSEPEPVEATDSQRHTKTGPDNISVHSRSFTAKDSESRPPVAAKDENEPCTGK